MSGTEPPLGDLDPRVTVRKMSRARQGDKAGWVIHLDGEAIGEIYQKRLGRSVNDFYEAIGYFPGSGERVRLELSISFRERCATLITFYEDPFSSVHLPADIRRRHQ